MKKENVMEEVYTAESLQQKSFTSSTHSKEHVIIIRTCLVDRYSIALLL